MSTSANDLKKVPSRAASSLSEKGTLSIHEVYVDPAADAELAAKAALPTFPNERTLLLKLDMQILPVLSSMYLVTLLDKGNLANAQASGLQPHLQVSDGQFKTILNFFFAPYVLFAVPVALLGKLFGPSRVLSVIMCVYGAVMMLNATVHDFGGMMALRWIMGMTESGFLPLVIFYLSTFYRRGELAGRLAMFFAGSNLANAFSAILAYLIFNIKDPKIPAWRTMCILEGSTTMLLAIFAFFYMPRAASQAMFLSDEERKIAFLRIQQDASSHVNEPFVLKDTLKVFLMPVAYVWLAIEICVGVPVQSVALFLPQIVSRLGYTPLTTILYAITPNCVGAVFLVLLAFASDFARLRFPFIALGCLLTCVGYVVYAAIDVERELRVAYFASFVMTCGASAPYVLLTAWYSNNIAHEGRRVALTALGVPLANLMGLVPSNVFRNQDAPKFIPALASTAAFAAVGMALTLLLGAYMVWDNKRRDAREGVVRRACNVSTEELREGARSPEFRWFL